MKNGDVPHFPLLSIVRRKMGYVPIFPNFYSFAFFSAAMARAWSSAVSHAR